VIRTKPVGSLVIAISELLCTAALVKAAGATGWAFAAPLRNASNANAAVILRSRFCLLVMLDSLSVG
jgi:hypothetical protein